jgi:hypothetical protein
MARSTKRTSHPERIAILETKVESMSSNLSSIESKLDELSAAMSRNKGFWGAVVLVVSALWAAVNQFGHLLGSVFSDSPKS